MVLYNAIVSAIHGIKYAKLTKPNIKLPFMKKAFKPLMVLFCACGLLACSNKDDVVTEQVQDQKRPTVDYEILPGDDPFTFTFQNKSSNYKELEWRFGDDSLSYSESPSHVFLADGKYEVTLKATAADGSTAKKLVVVKIDPEIVAKIVARKTGEKENEVIFSANSAATIASVTWDFGDKSAISEELSPKHVYPAGQLFVSNVVLKTAKGSTVKVSKLVSKDGSLVEVSKNYMLNTGPKFIASERVGNGRWGVVADWRVNAAVRQRGNNMGGWDEWEGNSMSMESWGGEADIVNGKIEQTSLVPMPAGQYYYELQFHDFQVKDLLYNVVAKGGSLPDVDNVTTDPNVLGFTKFSGNTTVGAKHYTAFTVPEASPVTFGFVSTFIQSDQNFKLTQIRLYQQDK
jgi:PKD repeat protein